MSEGLFLFGALTLLIVLNGLFVAAEFAVISLSKMKLEQEVARGGRIASKYLDIVSNSLHQDRFIAVAQVGISIVSLGLGMYGEHALAKKLVPVFAAWGGMSEVAAHSTATIVALSVLTYFHIVIGEMVPKTLALLHPTQTAILLWWPMRITAVILAPLSWILNGLGNLMLKLLRLPVSKDLTLVYSPDELRLVLEESRDGGLMPQEQHQMLERVIDFGERPLRLVMTPRTQIFALSADDTVADAIACLESEVFSRFPIYCGDRDNITGVVHVKDLFLAVRRGQEEEKLSMHQHPVTHFPESLPLDEAFDLLRASHAHLGVVAETRGGTAGIVTIEDLVEELFGEIKDEFDQAEVPLYQEMGPGWSVKGQMSLFDLEEILEDEFDPPQGAETLAGLLLALFRRIPEVGDVIEHNGYRFEIQAMERHSIASAGVWRSEPEYETEYEPGFEPSSEPDSKLDSSV